MPVAVFRNCGTRHDGLSKLETEVEGMGAEGGGLSFLRSMKKFGGNTALHSSRNFAPARPLPSPNSAVQMRPYPR